MRPRLLEEARIVIGGMDQFRAVAKGLAGGLEPDLRSGRVMFRSGSHLRGLRFQAKFPKTPLRLYVEALGA